jgi:hypothetical protein
LAPNSNNTLQKEHKQKRLIYKKSDKMKKENNKLYTLHFTILSSEKKRSVPLTRFSVNLSSSTCPITKREHTRARARKKERERENDKSLSTENEMKE